MDKLYRKVGRRYREVGIEFTGFPADGIWLVKNGKHSQMLLIGSEEIGEIPYSSLKYLKYHDDVVKAYMENITKVGNISTYDMIKTVLLSLAEVIEKEEQDGLF